MAIVNGPGGGGSGGGLLPLSTQLLANRQQTEAQRIQDQQEREAIRSREILDQDQRRRDANLRQQILDSETDTGGPASRGFPGTEAGQGVFGTNGNPNGTGSQGTSQGAPGGGFAGFGQAPFGAGGFGNPFGQAEGFDGFAERVRPRPSSAFLAQVIGQDLPVGDEGPRAAGVAELYRQTESAVSQALQRRDGRGAPSNPFAETLLAGGSFEDSEI